MLRSFFVFIFLSVLAGASESEVSATLRFQIWQPKPTSGIVTRPAANLQPSHSSEVLYFQKQGNEMAVECRSLRPTKPLQYRGDTEVEIFRKKAGELERVATFNLEVNGEYRVLLVPSEKGYRAFPISTSSKEATPGSVRLINYSGVPVQVVESGNSPVTVSHESSRWMKLKNASVAATHWTVKAAHDSVWKIEYQRAYVLQPNSHAVCFFYKFEQDKRVQMKFFTGL